MLAAKERKEHKDNHAKHLVFFEFFAFFCGKTGCSMPFYGDRKRIKICVQQIRVARYVGARRLNVHEP